jgi:hypothetical protein
MIEMCGYVFSTFLFLLCGSIFCVHNLSDFSFSLLFFSIRRTPRATLTFQISLVGMPIQRISGILLLCFIKPSTSLCVSKR